MSHDQPLWKPDEERIRAAAMTAFMNEAAHISGRSMADFEALHAWSIENRADFWSLVWDFCAVRGDKGETVLADGERMPGARFFPDARLNFAENLLSRTGDEAALIFRGEDKVASSLSWDELHGLVSRLQQAFSDCGLQAGDRVAAMMPNMPETIAVMLAASSLGAVFSSCSPDFGERGVLDRFGQIEPKIFVACDGYWYNGKKQDISAKLAAISATLKPLRTIVVPYLDTARTVAGSTARVAAGRQPFWRLSRPSRSPSSPALFVIRSTSCFPPARPAFPNASSIRPAARCSSTSRNCACMPVSSPATACSTSPPAAG